MWQHPRGPFGRAAHLRSARNLTQLYNDAKISYENTFGPPNTATNYDDDPAVVQLKKDFQEQQDRLLAWGVYWAEKQAGGIPSAKGKEAGWELNIDQKVDQAGLGEVVASIMENIRSTLQKSGQLQHPERAREHRAHPLHNAGPWVAFKSGMLKEKLAGTSPRSDPEKYKEYELMTGRSLLEKLKNSIDLLYSLDEGQEDTVTSSKLEKEKAASAQYHQDILPAGLHQKLGLTEPLTPDRQAQLAQVLSKHRLYIDFSSLEPMHDPNAAAEPPSYEEAKENTQPIQPRSVYFSPIMQAHVLVDLAKAKSYPVIQEAVANGDPIALADEIAQLVSGKGLLTWDGHLKLVGFTLAHANSRFGLVYLLPAPSDPTALQACQTLTTSIHATLEQETSFPPLENKFRLSYNIALTATSYLAHGHCHGHIKSSNIIFLRENDNPKLGKTLRSPYLLQPVQKLVGESSTNPPLSHTIYHHADADEVGYGVVPAFDVYSVGLLLLEIGLWRPLVTFWKQKYDRTLFHERLRKYYIPKLASKCGTRYMKLVQACFDAPDQLADRSSAVDAAEYLLEIVEDLGKCCALDEVGPPSELDIEVFESMIESQRIDNPQSSKSVTVPPVTPPGPPIHAAAPNISMGVPTTIPTKKGSTLTQPKQKSSDTLRKWPDMDIPQEHLETWNNMLMPRLSKMLTNIFKDPLDSCSVSLMMVGSTPEKAKTTICVQCRDTARVRETLCNRFKPKSGWGLVVCAGDVRRSGQIIRKPTKRNSNARRSGADADHIDINTEKPREQLYQPWPGCGASIGAWTDEQHLPPVSFGGTIVVDGQPYGMTVHHMLDDPEDVDRVNDRAGPEVPKRSTLPSSMSQTAEVGSKLRLVASDEDLPDALDELELYDDDEMAETSDEDNMSDTGSDASTIRPDYVVMGEEGSEFFIMDDSDDEDDIPDLEDDDYEGGHSSEESDDDEIETGSVGDTSSVRADRFDDEDFCITQPAWDDVPENFFSDDPEYRDEEHLLSHSFGLVHASSGLKRLTMGNLKHEVDWALIRIKDSRLNLAVNPEAAGLTSRKSSRSSKARRRGSTLPGASPFCEPSLTVVTPLTSLPRLKVSCTGRSSGRTTGRISQAMSLLKLPGRKTFSVSFTVEGGMGIPGDSGAWVYSEERRELCGHILAWSDALNMAYIVPMEVLFEDVKERLNAKEVRLPAQTQPVLYEEPIPELVQQGSSSTVASTRKGKSSVEDDGSRSNDNKENNSIANSGLTNRISNLNINTNAYSINQSGPRERERAQSLSRPSSATSRRGNCDEVSPISASSARRSRAETIPRTQSPTQLQGQLPTPPPSSSGIGRKTGPLVYEYEVELGSEVGDSRKQTSKQIGKMQQFSGSGVGVGEPVRG